MTIYVFETMTQGDAASFTALDSLTFATQTATATQVSVAPFQNNQSGSLGNSGITLTYGGKALTFPTDLATASETNSTNGGIQFRDGSHLIIGTGNGDTGMTGSGTNALTVPTATNPGVAPSSVVYGLGGSDLITGNNTNSYLYGGSDSTTDAQATQAASATAGHNGDTITAGSGNNHIYGNSLTTMQGSADGNDSITAGGGSNYINGNAGSDLIIVGNNATTGSNATAASTGSNRVFGGSGNDYITVQGAGANAVNGNVGNDVINASTATFNNTLRGGQGNDSILAGHGQDALMGDLGGDTLVAGTGASSTTNSGAVTYGHLTIMTGGADNDVFDFSSDTAGDAGVRQGQNNVHSGIVSGNSTYYQTITDFTQGSDTIHLGFNVAISNDIVRAQGGVTFTSVAAAEVYAQSLLDNHTTTAAGAGSNVANGEVAAIDVNGNTYLFFNHTGTGAIDSIVQLNGVSSTTLTQGGTGIHTFS